MNKRYKDFYEWWEENAKEFKHSANVEDLCLSAWDAGVQGTWNVIREEGKKDENKQTDR